VVHRDFLIKQTSKTLHEWGIPHDIIAPGHRTTGENIQVASVNTLARRLDSWTIPSLLVIDEAHHAILHLGKGFRLAAAIDKDSRCQCDSGTTRRSRAGRGSGRHFRSYGR
jgi:hypothetical protein